MQESLTPNSRKIIPREYLREYKSVFLFYIVLLAILIGVNIWLILNGDIAYQFELSSKNPLGIITSIFLQTSIFSVFMNVFSTIFLIIILFLAISLSRMFSVSSDIVLLDKVVKLAWLIPIVSTITVNVLMYLILYGYNLHIPRLSGFQVVVYAILGFALGLLLYAFMRLKWSHRQYLVVSTLLSLSILVLTFSTLLTEISSSMFYDLSRFLNLLFGFVFTTVLFNLKKSHKWNST